MRLTKHVNIGQSKFRIKKAVQNVTLLIIIIYYFSLDKENVYCIFVDRHLLTLARYLGPFET